MHTNTHTPFNSLVFASKRCFGRVFMCVMDPLSSEQLENGFWNMS